MSRTMADTPKRRARRQFMEEFKAGAVRLILDEGRTVGAAARDLDLTKTAPREWVRRAQADRTRGRTGLTTAERRILKRIAEKKTSKEIAAELVLSPRTVETHRANICTKLSLKGNNSLLQFALENRDALSELQ